MFNYYLTCRSLTFAQRSFKVLSMAGIKNILIRIPQEISGGGCGYALKIKGDLYLRAIGELKKYSLLPKRVFILENNGEFKEVSF